MAVSEEQLEVWSHQGSVAQSRDTYASIKSALEVVGSPYAGKNYEVFLQGSYGNDTNIYSESDVDVVICLEQSWYRDIGLLAEGEKAAYKKSVVAADYGHNDFKRDVLAVLQERYGQDVSVGDKAISISARGNRRKADVIVATQFRRYFSFIEGTAPSYGKGICFWNASGQQIVNYPKQHSENLTRKHQSTGSKLKPLVRVLKNLRGRLISTGLLPSGVAPSYFIEGLLHNVPDDRFSNTYSGSFVNAINWIQGKAKKDELVCANEQHYLLRDGSSTSWSKADADSFLKAVSDYWNAS